MTASSAADRVLDLTGTVQGVGFRPYVARLAAEFPLRGWVRNTQAGAQIRIEGSGEAIDAFAQRLTAETPSAAVIASVTATRIENGIEGLPPLPALGFVILASDLAAAAQPAAVTADLAVCSDCRRELADVTNRRYRYPFLNCTQCGPRYTILHSVPYDRARTTMDMFSLCPECAREYRDPRDRRFHAEPTACPKCGPHVTFIDGAGHEAGSGEAALCAAVAALRRGEIIAVKGIGGFHLMCDAGNEHAVEELRRRKHRDEKPFAVMFPSLASVRAAAELEPEHERLVTSAAAPIVLLRRKPGSGLAVAVAPGNPLVGALLPYSPLHVLILEAIGRPVVATSGNLAEEPLCFDNAEARARLAGIADGFLIHNRTIARPIDDSILRPTRSGAVMLRRARGFAPGSLPLPSGTFAPEPLLCVGGHLKNTIALAVGEQLMLGPHLGDLENRISVDAFRQAVSLLGALHQKEMGRVACDAHPDYASTHFAESLALPVTRVQHHLAHVLACLLEHAGGPARVLGVAWDGSGLGSDGTIWGGEFLLVDRVARTARRVARLRPFRLPGGEAAIREPRRSALGVLYALEGTADARWRTYARESGFNEGEAGVIDTMLHRGTHSPMTSSVGRLFDAVAALLGIQSRCSFEGQAALAVEFAAARCVDVAPPWAMPLTRTDQGWELDWAPMLRDILRETGRLDPAVLAARFHATLVGGIVSVAKAVGTGDVVLTGGCFQNVLLLEAAIRQLELSHFHVLRSRALPPNDGALAAGQALAALWSLSSVSN